MNVSNGDMKLILAGNYHEARNYMREHSLSLKDAVYIHGREQIMGVENPEVIKVGTWYERPDAREIEDYLKTRYNR